VRWGYGFDGADADADGDMFTWVVQEFPDHPPPPRGVAGSPAMGGGKVVPSQQDLLEQWRGSSGAAGVDGAAVAAGAAGAAGAPGAAEAAGWLAAAAVRPLVTGRPTVLLGPGVGRDAAVGDRVTDWL
jgi:hypothetical protein